MMRARRWAFPRFLGAKSQAMTDPGLVALAEQLPRSGRLQRRTLTIRDAQLQTDAFPIDVILVCIRWYAACPLSYRHIDELKEEQGVPADRSTINR